MNPATSTETRFALESFLPWWGIALLAMALLGVCWGLARRDGRLAERPWVAGALAGLRTISILVVIWMLAGPTWITVRRSSRAKSVAIVVDRSASMGLADPWDGSGNVGRWAAARKATPGELPEALASLDAAAATLRAAVVQLGIWGGLPETNEDATAARAALDRATRGVEEAVAVARRGLDRLGADRAGMEGEVDALASGALEVLRAKREAFGRGRTLASLDRERWLPGVRGELAEAGGRWEAAAERAWQRWEASGGGVADAARAVEAARSRWDKVEEWMLQGEGTWLGALRKKANLPRYEFGEKVVPLGAARWMAKPAGDEGKPPRLESSTRLGAALQQVGLDSGSGGLAAVVLVTDGGHNAGRDPREVAPGLAGVPLLVVPVGNTRMPRDVLVHHAHAPKVVLRQDQVVVDGVVTAYDCDGETLRVELVDNGIVVDQRTVTVRGDVHDARVALRWKAAEVGRRRLEWRVVPVARERTEANNATVAEVTVMEDRLRVLVADHFPRWETRYLLNLFKRDERITSDTLLFEPVRVRGGGAPVGFPTTVAGWSKYRVAILGDVWPSELSREQQTALRRWVTEAGGNLVLIAGKDAMPGAYLDQPLGALLPVEAGPRTRGGGGPYYLHLADEGTATVATQIGETPDASERLWRAMSERLPLHGLSEVSRPKRTAHTLVWAGPDARGFSAGDPATRSYLAWHYVGEGRVVYLAAPASYQLRYREGDATHHRFWGQLLRWAVARDLGEGSRTVRLSTGKSRYEVGESMEAVVRLSRLDGAEVKGGTVAVTAFQEGRAVQESALKEDPRRPGTYRATLSGLAAGPTRLEVGGETAKALLAEEDYRRPVEATVDVDPSGDLELRHPLCRLALLRETADAAGGVVVPPTGLPSALAQLDLDPEVREATTKSPLWNRWDLFWLFILCLGLEWAGRKWIGLV